MCYGTLPFLHYLVSQINERFTGLRQRAFARFALVRSFMTAMPNFEGLEYFYDDERDVS